LRPSTGKIALSGVLQLLKLDCVNLGNCVRPVRMDDDPVYVRDDQKRRVLQGNGILLKLCIGGGEVLALALIAHSAFVAKIVSSAPNPDNSDT
jgi:hypothetical protein